MVPKHHGIGKARGDGFRAVLFRMVPKPIENENTPFSSFRAVLFRMVPKPSRVS